MRWPLPVALAGSFSSDLGRNHRNDADDLRLRGKPVRIEAIGRPGNVVVHAVDAEAEKMFNLLCGTPPVPAGRLVAAGHGWPSERVSGISRA
jgi:hypothetical protein